MRSLHLFELYKGLLYKIGFIFPNLQPVQVVLNKLRWSQLSAAVVFYALVQVMVHILTKLKIIISASPKPQLQLRNKTMMTQMFQQIYCILSIKKVLYNEIVRKFYLKVIIFINDIKIPCAPGDWHLLLLVHTHDRAGVIHAVAPHPSTFLFDAQDA